MYALIEWRGSDQTSDKYGIDRVANITVHFHKRRLTEDQDLFVREGDFVLYGGLHYEISTLSQPRELFGQIDHKFEITAMCTLSREGLFDAN